MPTASELLLNLSIQVEGEEGLKTLGQELAALEAEQFKYNKQAQQSTVITEKVEAATLRNTKEFQALRAEVGRQIASNKHNEETVQALNKAHGLLSDQVRMAQATVAKYGQETQTNSDRQKILSDNLAGLSSRLDAVKTRARDLQTQMRSGGEMSQAQADEFRRVSDRAKELEKDAEKLTKAFGNNREETNAYRKILVDTRAVQSRLSSTMDKSQGTFAQLSGRIQQVNQSVNKLKNEFFESDLRAKELAEGNMTLAEANRVVEQENKSMTEVMQVHREVLRGMRDDLEALVQANEITRDEFNKLDKQLSSATVNAGTSQRAIQNLSKAFGSSAQVQNRATQALISFSQGLQDSPQFMLSAGAGFRAISNNMTQFQHMVTLLNESVKEANGGTATFGMTAKALAKGIIGPAGMMIAFTAVTTAIAFYTANLDRAKRKTKELSEETGSFIDKLNSLRKPLFADVFGTDELIFRSADIKAFLSDISSLQQDVVSAKFDRRSPLLLFASGRVLEGFSTFQTQLDILIEGYGERLPEAIAKSFPLPPNLYAPFRQSVKAQREELSSLENALESFVNKYGLTTKEANKLRDELESVNAQVKVNNFLLENSPLAQEIELRRRQLSVLELEAEHGVLTVGRANRERAALQGLNKERAESIFRLNGIVQSETETDEARETARVRLGELNAMYSETAAVIDFLTSFIDSNTESTEANNEALRDQYYFREQARQQAKEINREAQRGLDILGVESIPLARARAAELLKIKQDAAMEEGRTMLEQQLLLAQARREYDETIRQLDEEEIKRAEDKRDRVAKANHELNMIRIRQTKDGSEELEALYQSELKFLFQQFYNDETMLYEEYELKKTQLAEKYANLRAQFQQDESNSIFNSLQMGLQQVSQVFNALNQLSNTRAQVSEAAAKKEFETQKKLAYATAIVNAASAAVGVLKDEKGEAFKRILGMTAILAAAGAQIATIRRQKFGYGGEVPSTTGFQMSQVEGPQTFRTPGGAGAAGASPAYVPRDPSTTMAQNVEVSILADRKNLYSIVKKGQEEYESIQA